MQEACVAFIPQRNLYNDLQCRSYIAVDRNDANHIWLSERAMAELIRAFFPKIAIPQLVTAADSIISQSDLSTDPATTKSSSLLDDKLHNFPSHHVRSRRPPRLPAILPHPIPDARTALPKQCRQALPDNSDGRRSCYATAATELPAEDLDERGWREDGPFLVCAHMAYLQGILDI